MKMEKNMERKRWIDALRGVAISLVVLGHLVQGDNIISRWIASFHLALFFMLTGVLTALRGGYAGQSVRSVLMRRTKQLLYPYATFSILVMIYCGLSGKAEEIAGIAWSTITLDGHNTLWFLPALWMAECMFLLVERWPVRKSVTIPLLVVGTSAYAALQYYALGGGDPAQAGLLFQILNGFCRAGIGCVFILAGYYGYMKAKRMHLPGRKKQVLLSLAAFVLGCACGLMNGHTDLHFGVQANPLLYYAAGILQGGALIILFADMGNGCSWLEFFGKNSLIIMATHYPLPIIALGHRFMRYVDMGSGGVNIALACVLVMLIETGLILLINHFCPWMMRMPDIRRKRIS